MARLRLLALVAVLVCVAAGAARASAQGLTTGFSADPALTDGTAEADTVWAPRAVEEGASIVRINVIWSQVAPSVRPASFAPADPSSPGYNWTAVDAAVRALSGQGLQVLLNITGAPTWAEGPSPPAGVSPGSWRPDPRQFASFATAAALRYDGGFPDPLQPGALLPRVRYWQPWNEPNLSLYLSPQWTGSQHGWQPASPGIYRQLLNAFYGAVKRVSSSNFVVTAGTAPYGDPPGGQRMPPVAFDRTLFCLRGNARLTPLSCPNPPHFDALSHHPYGIQGPLWHALNPDDAAVPDIYKLARVLRAAEHAGHVEPSGPKQLWATEISWDSSPPDPDGVPVAEQARWLEQALYVLWRQGVSTVLWLQIVDSPPVPNYGSTYQAGLYYLTGAPKPAAQAYRFPFVTRRLNHGHIQAWLRAPRGGELVIQEQRRGRWAVLRRMLVRTDQVVQAVLPVRGRAVLRAQADPDTSLPWTQGA
ncbi:MAG TPA: hypothetical protein VFH80_00230 [Solirubrobacteraceae bacterium]|nr:hypothetical protein [Solirubrobacteraceae bacterium]